MKMLVGRLSIIAALAVLSAHCFADPWYDYVPPYLDGKIVRPGVLLTFGPPRTDDLGRLKIPKDVQATFRMYYYNPNLPVGSRLESLVNDIDTWSDPAPYNDIIEIKWEFIPGTFESVSSAYPIIRKTFTNLGNVDINWWMRDLADKLGYHQEANDPPNQGPVTDPNNWDISGQMLIEVVNETTGPTTPVVVDDGFVTASKTQLHATWSSSDDESGIWSYSYAIGTAPYPQTGYYSVVGWTSTGTATSVTRTGLNLALGNTYYFSVRAFNGVGMMSDVGVSDGITVVSYAYSYDSCGQATITNVNGTSTVYAYDERNRLTQVKHKNVNGTMMAGAVVNYMLDGVGNRLEMWLDEDPTNKKTIFGYDQINRLTSATYPGQSLINFTYDWVGNRLDVGIYDAADRLNSVSYNYSGTGSLLVGGIPSRTYTYDPRELLSTAAGQ